MAHPSRTSECLPEPSLRSRPPMPPCMQMAHLCRNVSFPGVLSHLCQDAEHCLATASCLVVWLRALGSTCQGLDAVSGVRCETCVCMRSPCIVVPRMHAMGSLSSAAQQRQGSPEVCVQGMPMSRCATWRLAGTMWRITTHVPGRPLRQSPPPPSRRTPRRRPPPHHLPRSRLSRHRLHPRQEVSRLVGVPRHLCHERLSAA